MRPRLVTVLAVAAIVLGSVLAVPAAWGKFAGGRAEPSGGTQLQAPRPAERDQPTPAPAGPSLSTATAGAVELAVEGFGSWAMLDHATGKVVGSANLAEVSSTESMIKAWIVADVLRREEAAGRNPSKQTRALGTKAIVDSSDAAAQTLYRQGGHDAVIKRLIRLCGLEDTYIGDSGWWSRTQMSARDAVRMGQCLVDGRAAGPRWTPWLLEQMRAVRGDVQDNAPNGTAGGGRWGIVDGLPEEILEQGVGIKNGWTRIGDDPVRGGVARDNSWHVNCFAVHADWSLAVLLRYPANKPLSYGAKVCASVARQLVVRP